MTIDKDSARMPIAGPRNLVRLANAAKKFDCHGGYGAARDQLDERGFLHGRVIVIKVTLELVVDKIKDGKRPTRRIPAQRWSYSCPNSRVLRGEAKAARKALGGAALPESAGNYASREASRRALETLGLGADFPVFFSEDMVLLDGYADHHVDRNCPGLPLELRAFLGRFRRHLMPLEHFVPLFDTLGSDENAPVSSPAVDYLELFFPERQAPSPPETPSGGPVLPPPELDREVVVCVNTGEDGVELVKDGLLPCHSVPAKFRAFEGSRGYGSHIATVERSYADCQNKSVSDERLAEASRHQRVLCVFRRPRS